MLAIGAQFRNVLQSISSAANVADLLDPHLGERDGSIEIKNAKKSKVLYQAACFKQSPLDEIKCLLIANQVLFLLNRDRSQFTEDEMSDLFFASTRLLESRNVTLKRAAHSLIIAISPKADISFIMVSSLARDAASNDPYIQANALRTIFSHVDASNALQLERHLKQSLASSHPFVASTAVLCGLLLLPSIPEAIRRWLPALTDRALTLSNPSSSASLNNHHSAGGSGRAMIGSGPPTNIASPVGVSAPNDSSNSAAAGAATSAYKSAILSEGLLQSHALALIFALKKTDKLALHFTLTQMANTRLPPLTHVRLLRQAAETLSTFGHVLEAGVAGTFVKFLESSLAELDELVRFEAARQIVALTLAAHQQRKAIAAQKRGKTPAVPLFSPISAPHSQPISSLSTPAFVSPELKFAFARAILCLQLLLSSTKHVTRYAALKVIHRIAFVTPASLAKLAADLESLLSDASSPVAGLALVTFLKINRTAPVEKLLKLVEGSIADFSEAQKIQVISSLVDITLSSQAQPSPNTTETANANASASAIVNFISNQLRDDLSSATRLHSTSVLIALARHFGGAVHDSILTNFCEVIEDCDQPALSLEILNFLRCQIPQAQNPMDFVRFVCNRVVLEEGAARAAAVEALIEISRSVKEVRETVLPALLKSTDCHLDPEDSIRSRALAFLASRKSDHVSQLDETETETETDVGSSFEDDFGTSVDVEAEAEAEAEAEGESEVEGGVFSFEDLEDYLVVVGGEEFEPEMVDLNNLPARQNLALSMPSSEAQSEGSFPAPSSFEAVGVGAGGVGGMGGESCGRGERRRGNAVGAVPTGPEPLIHKLVERHLTSLAPTAEPVDANAMLGNLVHVSKPRNLTEEESEYIVTACQRFYSGGQFLVVEISVHNTLSDVTLHNVDVNVANAAANLRGLSLVSQCDIPTLLPNATQSLYLLFQISQAVDLPEDHTTHIDTHPLGLTQAKGQNRFIIPSQSLKSRLSFAYQEATDNRRHKDSFDLAPIRIDTRDQFAPVGYTEEVFQQLWDSPETSQVSVHKISLGKMDAASPAGCIAAAADLVAQKLTPFFRVRSRDSAKLKLAGTLVAARAAVDADSAGGDPFEEGAPLLVEAHLVNSAAHGVLGKITIKASRGDATATEAFAALRQFLDEV